MINLSKFLPFFIPNVYRAFSFFMNLDLFCIDNARVIYRKIRYVFGKPQRICQTYRRKPTRYNWMVYCVYNPLNMFRALICPSSGARDYTCYCRIWCVMHWLLVVGGQVQGSRLCVRDEGSCSSSFPAPDRRPPATKALHTICGNNKYSLELLMMGIWVPETCWADYNCNKSFSSI